MNRVALFAGFAGSLLACLMSCEEKNHTLFRLLPSDETGITFTNQIEDNDTFNILTHEYIYNGGGVGIADFNNDGFQDVFFTGNLVPNRLYLNKGDFHFEDVTEEAGVNVPGRWNSGVAVADINNDGLADIYVCATMLTDSSSRRNMMFINEGPGDTGVPRFSDQAAAYGIEDGGYSVAAAFIDYDKDEDLDLYILINQRMDNVPTNYRPKISDGSASNNDRLYRNNSDGSFTNVTIQAGITLEGFGLGLAVSDIDMDGWPDIYVSNDYLSNDVLYMNNRDGTFTNRIAELMGHQSQFSMGNDVADINNDAMPDVITLDMLPETNDRKKSTISNKSYLTNINNDKYGYEYQYVRNMLQLNNGADRGVKFSEIGQLAGVHQTEWSWSPLFADFDNDGNKDLIITNGFPKDVTDKDFANYRSIVGNIASLGLLEDSIPVVRVPNYAFRNNGDLTFDDVTMDWGLDIPAFSNGAAFADFDNDGDLDYVVNNINQEALLYENTLYEGSPSGREGSNAFLRIKLARNLTGPTLGTKLTLYVNGTAQYFENTVYRGFLSSVEDIIHFGMGQNKTADSLVVRWPNGNVQTMRAVNANQVMTVEFSPAASAARGPTPGEAESATIFKEHTLASGILHKHEEDDKIDFNVQRTLPHKFTECGPGLAVGDVNGDGLEDLVVGGSTNYPFSVFTQTPRRTFVARKNTGRDEGKAEEDGGLLLFDADNDGDLDLYIVSGSIENYNTQDPYQDRLYKNNGNGEFTLTADALPDTRSSGSCARAADFDADGDLDLFVGGRSIPGTYPFAPDSYLLRNDVGKFVDITDEAAPGLRKAGMISDAIWTDFNGDGKPDLVLVGEFTPVMFFGNSGNSLGRLKTEVDSRVGWWNSIVAGDFDKDGDTDYVAGNLGLNNSYQATSQFPLRAYAKDFDGNGSVDPILACFARESMGSDKKKLYPVHFWDELNSQSPKFRNKYSRYEQYGRATLDDLLTAADTVGMLRLEANQMATSYIENEGNGKFSIVELPLLAQAAPVNGMLVDDVNGDGDLDVVMVGNNYGNEVFSGRYDAFTGMVAAGDGAGRFDVVHSVKSGFYVPGDARALVKLSGELFIASQNKDSIKVFTKRNARQMKNFMPASLDCAVDLIFNDGSKQRFECYHGSGYLSQSTRTIPVAGTVRELVVFDSQGRRRQVDPSTLEVISGL